MSLHRLSRLYQLASPDERISGLDWYVQAHLEACALADRHGITLGCAAGVIAALSPNCKWKQNLADADRLLGEAILARERDEQWRFQACKVVTYHANKAKAWEIASTGKVFPTLRGPKVEAFYHNLCGDWSTPAIDTHAVNAYFGERVTGSNLPTLEKGTIDRIREAYIRLAKRVGIEPAALQAILWLVHKRRIEEGRIRGYGDT